MAVTEPYGTCGSDEDGHPTQDVPPRDAQPFAGSPPEAPHPSQQCTHPNPYSSANLLSRETRWFLNDLLEKGSHRPLESEDLYKVDPEHEAQAMVDLVAKHWEHELQRDRPSLIRALIKAFWKPYTVATVVLTVQWGVALVEPLWVSELLSFFGSTDADEGEGWLYAGLYLACSLVRLIAFHSYFYRGVEIGMQCRVACTGLLYRKLLRLSSRDRASTSTGHLVNLTSNDAERFDFTLLYMNYLWLPFIKVGVALYMIWSRVGVAALAGVGLCLLLGPLQCVEARLFNRLRAATTALTDRRVKIMSELVGGIRLIKMYAWERPFAWLVDGLRRKEVKYVRRANHLRALNLMLYHSATHLMMFFMLAIYVATGGVVTPDRIFIPHMYLSLIRISTTYFTPYAVQSGAEALVSLQRMEDFLLKEEYHPREADDTLPDETMADLKAVTARWTADQKSPTLRGVSLTVGRGELVGIGGVVGSGKSSLVSAILGELPVEEGSLRIASTPTVYSQEVWIMSGTVQCNILFGKEMDEARYKAVVEACCLDTDFMQFANGDMTMVGERGITLSGGQKARIGLARACYQGGDLFILDDPLSALDTIVGRHVFDRCICGLLANTTRIVVTHQHHFLSACHSTYFMKKGCLEKWEVDCSVPSPTAAARAAAQKEGKESLAPSLETPEECHTGSISWRVYVSYLRHGTSWVGACVLFVMLLAAQGSYALTDLWLARWADRPEEKKDNRYHMRWYIVFIASLVVFGLARAVGIFHVLLKASCSLHKAMFAKVSQSPTTFFDTNPSGRILNRFSKDLGYTDEVLPETIYDYLQATVLSLGMVVVVAIVNPWVLLSVLPLIVLFALLLSYHIKSAREIKRLESVHRSPLYTAFAESFAGLYTIRAFRQVNHFVARFFAVQNDHTSAYFIFRQMDRWLGLRLDLISWLFTVATTVGLMLRRDAMSGGDAALSLAYMSALAGEFQWAVRQSAEVENCMTSVERLRSYTKLSVEGTTHAVGLPQTWPTAGAISFSKYSLQYRPELPMVLKGITCDIAARHKVGIVGRTGAGKSSLMQGIFRLTEPAMGAITIDGVVTTNVELGTLRSAISAIPQDPVLFTGSLRYNLDPFATCDDIALWEALRAVQLDEYVKNLEGVLDFEVSEGGQNFSVGQRQMICLARAILRKNSILIMDEATANMDPETDEAIQRTVRTHFKECTVLTIAHRLHTIIDCDRVMVLHNGELVAYGHPHELLQDPQCLFTKYVVETGPDTERSLRAMAHRSYSGIE